MKQKPPAAGTASARARDRRDSRVDVIVGLMARGEWESAATVLRLAGEWKVSRHAVSEYAREASGIVRRIIDGNPDAVLGEILAGIERVRVVALSLTKYEKTGKDTYEERCHPNVDAALRAYELRAKMLGLVAEKLEISGEIAALSDEETERRLVAALEQLRSKRKGGS